MRRSIAVVCLLILLLGRVGTAQELVRRHALPDGAASPDVIVTDGAVHLVYGAGGDAFHQRSEDGGLTFGAAVRVNDRQGTVFSACERGPRVALGGDGTIHVVSAPNRLLGVNYARRRPGADTFELTRDLRYEGATAAEGAVVAANGDTVWVIWLDGKSGEPRNSPVGLPLFGRVSRDGGQTFEAGGLLPHDYDGGACACCHLAAAFDAEGRLLLAFRGARNGVRDVFLLRGERAGRRFRTARVTEDEWVFRGCPMDGPRIGQGKDSLLVAHTVDGRVGWSRIDDGRVQPPQRPDAPRGRFPLALQRPDGALLLAWIEGDNVKWVARDERGRIVNQGTLPGTATRPAGFVDRAGSFVLVY